MTSRLTLICQGATAATRSAAFAADEPLESGAPAAAAALRPLRAGGPARVSPMRAARQTAEALGFSVVEDPALRDLDHGRWAGRTVSDIARDEPDALARWLADPEFDGHGGESVAALLARMGAWLDQQAVAGGRSVAVTHAALVRAAVVRVLGAPAEAFWRVDIAPLTMTGITHDGRRWALRHVGSPLGTDEPGPEARP